MSNEEIELDVFYDAADSQNHADPPDGQAAGVAVDAGPDQAERSDARTPEPVITGGRTNDVAALTIASSRSFSDLTQLLLASTAFIACLTGLAALNIQV